MFRAILNKSWRQHPTRHQLYGHRPPITKTIQVRRTRHAGHCWRSKDELISWTTAYGQATAGRPAWTYIQQLCGDTGCSPEDLPEAMNDKEKWQERVRDIRASGTTWWWHIQPYTYTRGNVVSTIMTSEHTSLEKYTSHLRKGYVWEVSWRLNKDCNILTPSSFVFSSISFSFSGAAQPGVLMAQLSAESWFSLPRTATTDS